jgi:hypothetical protein
MTTRLFARIRDVVHWAFPAPGPRRTAPARRRTARTAVLLAGPAFALLTLALIVASETTKPEWRDPEYGHRLRRVRWWQHKQPDRPLVLVLGSSRVQMGVSPSVMNFPDEPGSPLVYNFGYRGGYPLVAWLQLMRLFDAGVKPRAVVFFLASSEVMAYVPADYSLGMWPTRFSSSDLRRLAPYTENPADSQRELSAARSDPWTVRREVIVSDLLPQWQLYGTRLAHDGWERMDPRGFVPYPEERMTPEQGVAVWRETRATQSSLINDYPLGPMTDRVVRDMVNRCRAEGVEVALAWAPESPGYRALYTTAGRARQQSYTRVLRTEVGVRVFPPPEHLDEADFADGYHLLPGGAARYSRWLAEVHLKPWLAEVLK